MEAFLVFFVIAVMVALGSVVVRQEHRNRGRSKRPGKYNDSGMAHTSSYGSTSGADSGDCGPGESSSSGSGSGWSGGDSGGSSGGDSGGGGGCD